MEFSKPMCCDMVTACVPLNKIRLKQSSQFGPMRLTSLIHRHRSTFVLAFGLRQKRSKKKWNRNGLAATTTTLPSPSSSQHKLRRSRLTVNGRIYVIISFVRRVLFLFSAHSSHPCKRPNNASLRHIRDCFVRTIFSVSFVFYSSTENGFLFSSSCD